MNSYGNRYVKICSNCGRPMDEVDPDPTNPAEILGDLFHESVSPVDAVDICPACREELGMLNIMGFDD